MTHLWEWRLRRAGDTPRHLLPTSESSKVLGWKKSRIFIGMAQGRGELPSSEIWMGVVNNEIVGRMGVFWSTPTGSTTTDMVPRWTYHLDDTKVAYECRKGRFSSGNNLIPHPLRLLRLHEELYNVDAFENISAFQRNVAVRSHDWVAHEIQSSIDHSRSSQVDDVDDHTIRSDDHEDIQHSHDTDDTDVHGPHPTSAQNVGVGVSEWDDSELRRAFAHADAIFGWFEERRRRIRE
ncbi:hypothetical protein P171DRAFT_441741 [Karstenula rhodostoma CBS 690.94]|uniref:Uncharacterized protein n=1 Tax=Karstenula rhodostoma CBS 690.94 TaxID=1392251 RepID=A0A9P4PRB5_9PLEO|nr:hypothetical protein P171DRAFT_441741 [Karstenula rhodostoma CBS 690.94]